MSLLQNLRSVINVLKANMHYFNELKTRRSKHLALEAKTSKYVTTGRPQS